MSCHEFDVEVAYPGGISHEAFPEFADRIAGMSKLEGIPAYSAGRLLISHGVDAPTLGEAIALALSEIESMGMGLTVLAVEVHHHARTQAATA